MSSQTLPPPEGPEYTPCACSHIEPEHDINGRWCAIDGCECSLYRPAAAPAGPTPATDRDETRARIADALRYWVHPTDRGTAAAAVLAVLPAPDQRAAVLLEAADFVDVMSEGCSRARPCTSCNTRDDVSEALRRLAGEAQQDEGDEGETDEQRADREETERDHAAGDHTHCGITCETELPTEHLRNFVIAKGYPGTKGALDELLRRAAVGRSGQPETDTEAFCGFGVTDTPGSGCVLLAGHEPANRHIVTPGDTDDD